MAATDVAWWKPIRREAWEDHPGVALIQPAALRYGEMKVAETVSTVFGKKGGTAYIYVPCSDRIHCRGFFNWKGEIYEDCANAPRGMIGSNNGNNSGNTDGKADEEDKEEEE